MSTENSIKLYHFGEALISAILSELDFEEIVLFLKDESFCPVIKDSLSMKDEKISQIQESIGSSKIEVKTLQPIKSKFEKKNFEVDTQHTLDVGVFAPERNVCFPIEVKMGTTGAVESWSKFQSYMLESPVKERTDNNNDQKFYLDGAMASFLAGFTGDEIVDYKLVIMNGDNEFVMNNWGLCIRRGNKKFFKQTQVPVNKIPNLPLVFTFEDLVQFYDATEKGKKKPHTELVKDILESSKKYLNERLESAINTPKDGHKSQRDAKEKNKLD